MRYSGRCLAAIRAAVLADIIRDHLFLRAFFRNAPALNSFAA